MANTKSLERSHDVYSECMETDEGFFVYIIRLFSVNSADACGQTVETREQCWAVFTAVSEF